MDTDLHFHACNIGQDLEVQPLKEEVAVHGIICLGPSTLNKFAAWCEVVEIRISIPKSQEKILSRKAMDCPL